MYKEHVHNHGVPAELRDDVDRAAWASFVAAAMQQGAAFPTDIADRMMAEMRKRTVDKKNV